MCMPDWLRINFCLITLKFTFKFRLAVESYCYNLKVICKCDSRGASL